MAKIPLLLVPGLLCTDDLWRDQVANLGDIAEIRITRAQRQFDNLSDMARSILAEAPDRFALAGLSMGGYVAFEIMRQAAVRVRALALLDTSARPDTIEQTTRRKDLMSLAEKGKFKGVTPRLLPLFLHPDRLGEVGLTSRVSAMAEEVGRDGFLRQQAAIIARPDSRPMLQRIACPTLVLCGDQDLVTPPELSREIAAGIAGAELVLLPRCGHLSTMEMPAEVNAAMRRWLLCSG
ncbi:MAG: alpha/beta fold hydrolase [Alphaproteobacteria bacterium]|nr:alpha/beta fold hydrolase [Alphaproteobacteria bacterium]